ncbi:MAG: hypothetical protein ABFS32_21550 [Bacteroidota bacterium]
MKKIRIGAIVLGIIIIMINLTAIDYGNLNWSANSKSYLSIIAFCILIFGLVYSIKYDEKNK